MDGRWLAGAGVLVTVLGILWLRASTLWIFHLF